MRGICPAIDAGSGPVIGQTEAVPDLDLMLADLATLVNVESPSRDLAALARSAATLATVIEQRLGGSATLIESAAGPHVHWSGGGEPKVLVLGHHDQDRLEQQQDDHDDDHDADQRCTATA